MDIIYDVKDTIILNNKELLSMTKEYMIVYMKSLLFDLYGAKRRKILRKRINEYSENIQLENLYLEMIIDNIDFIDEAKTEMFMNKLDRLNEKTYKYYESILGNFEKQMFNEEDEMITLPSKDFKTITEDIDCHLELLNIFILPKGKEINQDNKKINKILSKK